MPKDNKIHDDFKLEVLKEFQEVFSHFYFARNTLEEAPMKICRRPTRPFYVQLRNQHNALFPRSTVLEINQGVQRVQLSCSETFYKKRRMKTYTTNYFDTFIEVADDSKAECGTKPPTKEKKTVAEIQ